MCRCLIVSFILLLCGPLWADPPSTVVLERNSRVLRALGDLSDLPAEQRSVFLDWTDFEMKSRSRGETVPEYLSDRYNRPSQRRSRIIIQPMGPWPVGVSGSALEDFLSAFLQVPVQLAESPITTLPLRQGGKISAERLQQQLLREIPGNAFAVLGLLNEDIYSEDSGPTRLLFGQGHYVNRTGVASLARLQTADLQLLHHRAFKLTAHELLHTFGMKHCNYFRCLMNSSGTVAQSDRRPLALCPVCLRKLQKNVGFDPMDRYRAVASTLGPSLAADSQWMASRTNHLKLSR